MATPRLLMRDFQQILRLKYEAGLSNRAIARACSVGVGTVSNYLVRAKTAGLGWPLPDGMDEATLSQAIEQQRIEPGQLTLHADRGSSMRSKPVAFLLADLGVTKTHSRPYTSSDNPYSEAHFRTLKYRPEFPARFDSIQQARSFCRAFFHWYNHCHRHSGIGLVTPATMHLGLAQAVQDKRAEVLLAAFRARPERFVNSVPQPPQVPTAAWINKPCTMENAH